MNNESMLMKHNLYDSHIKDLAEKSYKNLLYLEDKVSQLFFLMTEASYDPSLLEEIELVLSVWKCGGVIFLGGNSSRKNFLIHTFKEISKNHLLIGNDLQHGLAVLVEETNISLNNQNLDWFFLGQELFFNNLNHGIFIQLSFNLGLDIEFFNSRKDKSIFFKGIKNHKQAVVASCITEISENHQTSPTNSLQTCSLEKLKQSLYHYQRGQLSNYEEMAFVNLSSLGRELTASFFMTCFKSGTESFLFSSKDEINTGVKLICELIRSGKLSALLFDKVLEKVLILKALSQQISSHDCI